MSGPPTELPPRPRPDLSPADPAAAAGPPAAARRYAGLATRIAAGAAVAALAAVPFLGLLILLVSESEEVERIDQGVADGLNAWARERPGMVSVLQLVSRLTSPWTFRLAVLIAAGLLWSARARRLAVWAVVTMTVGGLLNVAVKELVQRARPTFPEPVAVAADYSFPSGHAQNSLLGAAILLLIAWPLLGRSGRVLAGAAGAFLVLLTGLDRIGLGVHYLSDVLAGWLLALALLAGTTIVFDARRRGPAGIEAAASSALRPAATPERPSAPASRRLPTLLGAVRGLLGRLLLAAAGILAVLLALGWLVVALDDVGPFHAEESVLDGLVAQRTPTGNGVAAVLSWFADTPRIVAGLVIMAALFRLVFHRWRESAFIVAAVTMHTLTFLLATAIIARDRPAVEQLDVAPPTSSFPSGHVGAALTLYGAIALVLAWHTRQAWLKPVVWVVLLAPPLCVAYARLYQGMHFPSDVAGSLVNFVLCTAVTARSILFAALPAPLRHALGPLSAAAGPAGVAAGQSR